MRSSRFTFRIRRGFHGVRRPKAHNLQLARVESMVGLLDGSSTEHCERVAQNARRVALELGASGTQADVAFWTGLLHDIGKLGISRSVLDKPGPLDESEWIEVRRHPDLGADLLTTLGGLDQIAAGVRAHHERWDGTGYPARRSGDDIPMAGRIVAVADAFEALTSERPYSAPIASLRAVACIRDDAGRHFDPDVVEAFDRVWTRGELSVAQDRTAPVLGRMRVLEQVAG